MKKRKNRNKIDCSSNQNPVAKFAHKFNKTLIFNDKNKYRRNAKYRHDSGDFSNCFSLELLEKFPAFWFLDFVLFCCRKKIKTVRVVDVG